MKCTGWGKAAMFAAAAVIFAVLFAGCTSNMSKMQAKSKQSEARTNLRAIYTMQAAYQGVRDTYGSSFDLIGFEPKGTTAYSYFVGNDDIQATKGGPYNLPADVKASVGKTDFQVVAVGNIDDDDTLDVWVMDQDLNIRNVVNDVNR